MTDDKTTDLADLLERARAVVEAMTPEQHREMIAAQRRSYVIGEAAMGNDADEEAYRAALFANDQPTLARLVREGEARAAKARAWLKEQGL